MEINILFRGFIAKYYESHFEESVANLNFLSHGPTGGRGYHIGILLLSLMR
jgi:hypothetical protein